MTGYRSGFVAGDPELIAAMQGAPPVGRRDAAGVRPARLGRRLERREPRRGDARRSTHGSGSCSSTCSRRAAFGSRASAATFYLWVAVPGGGRLARVVDRAPRRCRRARRPRLVLRTGGGGLRADGDGAHDRGVRARGRGPRRRPAERRRERHRARRADRAVVGASRIALDAGAVEEAVGDARSRRAPRGGARRRRLDRERVGEEGGPALLPGPRPRDDRGRARSSTTTGCR